MYYSATLVTLAFAAASAAWPSHGNSTTVAAGPSSALTAPTAISHPSASYIGSRPFTAPTAISRPSASHIGSGSPSARSTLNTASTHPFAALGTAFPARYPLSHGTQGPRASASGSGFGNGSRSPISIPGSGSGNEDRSPINTSGSGSGKGDRPPISASGSGSGNGGHPTTSALGTGLASSSTVRPGLPDVTTTVTLPGISSTTTEAHPVTSELTTVVTKFIPCSSAIATIGGFTYYSSSLTTSHVTSTNAAVYTEYTVICPTPDVGSNVPEAFIPSSAKGQGERSNLGQASGTGFSPQDCPPASTVYQTVYVTVTPSIDSLPTPASSLLASSSSPGNRIPKSEPPYPLGPSPSANGSGTRPAGPTGTGSQSIRQSPTGAAKPSGSAT